MSRVRSRRHATRALGLAVALVAGLCIVPASGPASAGTIQFNSIATSGQFVLKKGDPSYQQILSNPTGTLTSSVDDQTGAITASTTFAPSYTVNQLGPFNFILYIKADIIQSTPFTGTVSPNGAVDVTGNQILAITVYRTTTGTVGQSNGQNPATDQILANGKDCRVTLTLHLTGSIDFATNAATIGQDPFVIPNFPVDNRSSGGTTAGCAVASSAINQQLPGPNNTVSLSAGGTAVHAPEAPGQVTATGGDGQATLSGPVPVDYGSPIDHYTVTPYLAAVAQTPVDIPAAGPPVVTGLTNGLTYTFKVTATNANGTGPASLASNAVTIGVPDKPAFPSASSLPGQIKVTWWQPADNGSPIISSTVTPYVGGVAQAPITALGDVNNQILTVAPGTSYTYTVTVKNLRGDSIASDMTSPAVQAS